MNIQDILTGAIRDLSVNLADLNLQVCSSSDREFDIFNNNIGYALTSIIEVSRLLVEIREHSRHDGTMLRELSTISMWDRAPHGHATFEANGIKYSLDGRFFQYTDGFCAFKSDTGDIFDYLNPCSVIFTKDTRPKFD